MLALDPVHDILDVIGHHFEICNVDSNNDVGLLLELAQSLGHVVDNHVPLVLTDHLHDLLRNLKNQIYDLRFGLLDYLIASINRLIDDDMQPLNQPLVLGTTLDKPCLSPLIKSGTSGSLFGIACFAAGLALDICSLLLCLLGNPRGLFLSFQLDLLGLFLLLLHFVKRDPFRVLDNPVRFVASLLDHPLAFLVPVGLKRLGFPAEIIGGRPRIFGDFLNFCTFRFGGKLFGRLDIHFSEGVSYLLRTEYIL